MTKLGINNISACAPATMTVACAFVHVIVSGSVAGRNKLLTVQIT